MSRTGEKPSTEDYLCYKKESYIPNNRNSPKSERIENVPLAILISTEQF